MPVAYQPGAMRHFNSSQETSFKLYDHKISKLYRNKMTALFKALKCELNFVVMPSTNLKGINCVQISFYFRAEKRTS